MYMKYTKLLIALAASIFLFFAGTAHAATLFSDGFESDPMFQYWDVSGAKWSGSNIEHDGTASAKVEGSTDTTNNTLQKATSTEGYGEIVLSYWYRVNDSNGDRLESGDDVVVEYTFDGEIWNQLFAVTENENDPEGGWHQNTHELDDAEDAANFAFRFAATLSSGSDKVRIDDVLLLGELKEAPEIEIPTDVCPNLEGDQEEVPEGFELVEDMCVESEEEEELEAPPESPVPPAPPPTIGSSSFDYWGCTDSSATNFNSLANKDDGSCKKPEDDTLLSPLPGPPAATSTAQRGEVLGAAIVVSEPPACVKDGPYFTAYLQEGRDNDPEEVKKLQTFLNKVMGANLPVTGHFGPLTKEWVKKFQELHKNEILLPWGLHEGTGHVYITTKRYINLLQCPEMDIPMPAILP